MCYSYLCYLLRVGCTCLFHLFFDVCVGRVQPTSFVVLLLSLNGNFNRRPESQRQCFIPFRPLTPSYIDLVSIVIVLATNSCLDLEEETVVYLHVLGVFIVAVEHVCKWTGGWWDFYIIITSLSLYFCFNDWLSVHKTSSIPLYKKNEDKFIPILKHSYQS